MADTANPISAPAVAVKTRSDLQDPSTQKSGRRQPTKSSSKRDRESSSGSSPPKKRRQVAKQDMFRSHRFDSSVSSASSLRRSSGRSEQDEDEITYTRTGRVSKAKKGKKVHLCDCGKAYTRAEHLRRHMKNHEGNSMTCDHPGCGRTFHRADLLARHKERHDEQDPREGRLSVSLEPSDDGSFTYSAGLTAFPAPATTGPTFQSPWLPTTSTSQMPHTIVDDPMSMPPPSPDRALTDISSTRPFTYPIPLAGPSVSQGPLFFPPVWGSPESFASSRQNSPLPQYSDLTQPILQDAYHHPRFLSSTSVTPQQWQTYPPSTCRSPLSMTSSLPTSSNLTKTSPPPQWLGTTTLSQLSTESLTSTDLELSASFVPLPTTTWKTFMDCDREENQILFPEPAGNLGLDLQSANRYLDNYWRIFHPQYPILHKPTIKAKGPTPILKAAMIAIGGQCTDEVDARKQSRILHDKGQKLLAQREPELMPTSRTSDMQAVFLFEMFSQFRGRRAPQKLSKHFQDVYIALNSLPEATTTDDVDALKAQASTQDPHLQQRWQQWVEISAKQRLLVACFILEIQQAMLLARKTAPPSGLYYPFPVLLEFWDTASSLEWSLYCQDSMRHGCPKYITDALNPSMAATGWTYDTFQCRALIATRYNNDVSIEHLDPTLGQPDSDATIPALNDQPQTKLFHLTAHLVRQLPLRALLAVSGEAWILSEKVPQAPFKQHKAELKNWIAALGQHGPVTSKPVFRAARLATQLLQLVTTLDHEETLAPGNEMGVYFAVLTFWAITSAVTVRRGSRWLPQTSSETTPSDEDPTTRTLASAEEEALSFLNEADQSMSTWHQVPNALEAFSPLQNWQKGVNGLLHWLQLRIHESHYAPLGELLNGIVRVLEVLFKRGWGEEWF